MVKNIPFAKQEDSPIRKCTFLIRKLDRRNWCIRCFYKLGLPTQFSPATFFKSWAGLQNEKNSILAKSQRSHAQSNFESSTHKIQSKTKALD